MFGPVSYSWHTATLTHPSQSEPHDFRQPSVNLVESTATDGFPQRLSAFPQGETLEQAAVGVQPAPSSFEPSDAHPANCTRLQSLSNLLDEDEEELLRLKQQRWQNERKIQELSRQLQSQLPSDQADASDQQLVGKGNAICVPGGESPVLPDPPSAETLPPEAVVADAWNQRVLTDASTQPYSQQQACVAEKLLSPVTLPFQGADLSAGQERKAHSSAARKLAAVKHSPIAGGIPTPFLLCREAVSPFLVEEECSSHLSSSVDIYGSVSQAHAGDFASHQLLTFSASPDTDSAVPSATSPAAHSSGRDNVGYHYRNVFGDPRLIRWMKRLDPDIFSSRTVKNAIDPQSIPFVGMYTSLAKRALTQVKVHW